MEVFDELPMPWRFAIERKTTTGMTDVVDAGGMVVPAKTVIVQVRDGLQITAINRMQWVLREDVFDVHQQQLLVLLLVLQAQLDPAHDFGRVLLRRVDEQVAHCAIDVLTEAVDVFDARARDQSTLKPWKGRAMGFVIGVVEVVVSVV